MVSVKKKCRGNFKEAEVRWEVHMNTDTLEVFKKYFWVNIKP